MDDFRVWVFLVIFLLPFLRTFWRIVLFHASGRQIQDLERVPSTKYVAGVQSVLFLEGLDLHDEVVMGQGDSQRNQWLF